MATIKTPSYIEGISGKVCRHEDNEYRTNSSSGKIVLSKKCNPFTGDPTEKQVAVRNDFSKRASAIRAWIASNKTVTEKDGVQVITLSKAYKAALSEKKVLQLDNIQAVLAKHLNKNADGTYTVNYDGSSATSSAAAGGNSGGGGGNTTPPSGGGDTF